MAKLETPIKQIVVLMLENRSFDHMLGYLKHDISEINGLTGSESNPTISGEDFRVFFAPQDSTNMYITDPDPDHEYPAVTLQLFESEHPTSFDHPTNRGFI